MTLLRLLPLSLALGAAFSMPAQAQSLLDLYASARGFDATYQSAKAQYDANQYKADQAKAALLPSANLSSSASRTNSEVRDPASERNFNSRSTTISLSQPLYRPANVALYEQGLKTAELAAAQLAAADQDLIVRVSQAYFDVLAAQDTLTFVRAQKAAVAEQLASAKRNFEVGTSTITDSREAQSRFDLVVAQEIAADNDLRVKKLALENLVGKPGAAPLPLAAPVVLPPLKPEDVNLWVQQSEEFSPTVLQARTGLDVARLETDKAKAGHKPTLDLSASRGTSRSPHATTGVQSRTDSTTVALTFNLPLFAGFATQNRIRETLSLVEKAEADLEAARRGVAQATRAAYFGVVSGQSQVKALEAAEASSQSALDANKLGYQVGVRINIDVLNSQSQLFQTKRDLAQARYNVLLGNLRLRQASGILKAEDLNALNALLVK